MDKELYSLALLAGQRLRAKEWTLATVESCTGGWIAQAITAVSGSSSWFECGFVTYSNESKQELVGVRADTLLRFGAVSEQTVHEMATGGLTNSRADAVIAVTGIAGPDGGTVDKPVGMVCFGWALRSGQADSSTHQLAGDREQVRRQSVIIALQGLIERL